MFEEYIINLEKGNTYLEKELQLKKEIYGAEVSGWKTEDQIKRNKILINFFTKINSIPKEMFDIESKVISPTLRYQNDEIYIEFSFVEDMIGKLYIYVMESYSDLYITSNEIARKLFNNIFTIPRINIEKIAPSPSDFEYCMEGFYFEVENFLKFLHSELGKIVLDTIDNYYLKLIDYGKKCREA